MFCTAGCCHELVRTLLLILSIDKPTSPFFNKKKGSRVVGLGSPLAAFSFSLGKHGLLCKILDMYVKL